MIVAAAVIDAMASLDLRYPKVGPEKTKELAEARELLLASKWAQHPSRADKTPACVGIDGAMRHDSRSGFDSGLSLRFALLVGLETQKVGAKFRLKTSGEVF